jgi:hypothetical protein
MLKGEKIRTQTVLRDCLSIAWLVITLVSQTFAKEKTVALPMITEKCSEPLPRVRSGCSGEICECRTGNSLEADSTLYSDRSDKSKILTQLKAGTRFKSRELFVVTQAYGVGTGRDFNGKSIGVQIASYFGEGEYELCGSADNQTKESLKVVQEPKYEDWAKVVLKTGQTGWIRGGLRTTDGDNCDFDRR